MTPDAAATRLLLVGCTGSGRTTVGQLVAARLDWPFLDDDAVLARTSGSDVATLYREQGAEGVAAAQQAALNLVLGVPAPLVASVGSGVLLSEAGRQRVRGSGRVVWLQASVATLARRVGRGDRRPWLGEDPRATLTALVAERSALYEEVAHQVVDVDVRSPGQVAREVLDGLPVGATV